MCTCTPAEAALAAASSPNAAQTMIAKRDMVQFCPFVARLAAKFPYLGKGSGDGWKFAGKTDYLRSGATHAEHCIDEGTRAVDPARRIGRGPCHRAGQGYRRSKAAAAARES